MEQKAVRINLPLTVIAVVVLGVALIAMKAILMPLVVAFFLACLAGPSIAFMKKKGIPTALSFLIIFILTCFVAFLVGRILYSQVPVLEKKAPSYRDRLVSAFENALKKDWVQTMVDPLFPDESVNNPEGGKEEKRKVVAEDFFGGDWEWVKKLPVKNFVSIAMSQLSGIFGIVGTSLLILVYLLFLLLEREQVFHRLILAYKEEEGKRIIAIIENIQFQTERYIIGKAIVSLITSVLVTVVLWIFGVELFVLWGFLTFLLNFIPNLGSCIATLLPLLVALVQPDPDDSTKAAFNLLQVFLLGGILIAIQIAVGSITEPRILGHRLRLSPFMVFFSFILWGWMWGIPGIILSVPIMATIRIVFENVDSLKPFAILVSNADTSVKEIKTE